MVWKRHFDSSTKGGITWCPCWFSGVYCPPFMGGGNSNIFGIFTMNLWEDEPILTIIFFSSELTPPTSLIFENTKICFHKKTPGSSRWTACTGKRNAGAVYIISGAPSRSLSMESKIFGWWQHKAFVFSHRTLGEMMQFDDHIFVETINYRYSVGGILLGAWPEVRLLWGLFL